MFVVIIHTIRKKFECLHKCPCCRVSHYRVKVEDDVHKNETKGPLTKVLWYLPIIQGLSDYLLMNIMQKQNLM